MKKTLIYPILVLVLTILIYFNITTVKRLWFSVFKKTGIIADFNAQDKINGDAFAYSDGILTAKSEWKNGQQDGESVEYYPTGQIKARSIYKNDKVIGTQYHYYENGGIYYTSTVREKDKSEVIYNYSKAGRLAIYDISDVAGTFFHIEYGNNGNINRLIGSVVSPNMYFFDNRDTLIVLKEKQHYIDIKDLFLTYASPPQSQTQINLIVNNNLIKDFSMSDNTIRAENAFKQKGTYSIRVIGSLSDSTTKKIMKIDTLDMVVFKD